MDIDRLMQMILRSFLYAFAHRLPTKWLIIGIVTLISALFFGRAVLDWLLAKGIGG